MDGIFADGTCASGDVQSVSANWIQQGVYTVYYKWEILIKAVPRRAIIACAGVYPYIV